MAGSKRWYKNNYQDAMTLVRKLGSPDLFVTVTCNPQWPEIQEALLPGQKATDRIDLVTRVWKLKLQAMIRDIVENHAFGQTSASVRVGFLLDVKKFNKKIQSFFTNPLSHIFYMIGCSIIAFSIHFHIMQVIEFQKRGLPHAHILVWLAEKLDTAEKIDKVVSAELPNKETDPDLYNLVLQHMVHGPCGTMDPKARCMKANKQGVKYCKYLYPQK